MVEELRLKAREYKRAYRHAHLDETRRRAREYRAAHLEERRIKEQAYRASRREIGRADRKKYYYGHLEESQAKSREYHLNNLEKSRAAKNASSIRCYYKDVEATRMRKRLWFHNNYRYDPARYQNDDYREKSRMRARVRAAAGVMTEEKVQTAVEVNIKQYGRLTCYLCGKPAKFSECNIEHMTPICRGGTHEQGNLKIAHKLCNLRKGARTYEECLLEHLFEGA